MTPMPSSLTGRRILITGASTGIGRATAELLAQRGATLYLAGRSEARHRALLQAIRSAGGEVSYLPLDLSELGSVRDCAARFLALDVPLHVLINNAGLAGSRGLTPDGFERTFGVNHLGHFLLTELLLDRLRASAPSRIVNVSSKAHYRVPGIDWSALRQATKTTTGFAEYRVSKLCNVLHAKELARRLDGSGVTTYSLHPGVVASDVWRQVPWGIRHLMRQFMQSNEQGAATSVHCAASEEVALQTGLYYDACLPVAPSALSEDVTLAEALRDKSLEWVGAQS
jgi:NAD(P)-dependent dehydrogenase (short-subunit alcohol dehydrogenase family)